MYCMVLSSAFAEQQNTTPLFSVPLRVRINRHRHPNHELLTQDWPGKVHHEAVCTLADFVQWHTKSIPSCWCWAATDLIACRRQHHPNRMIYETAERGRHVVDRILWPGCHWQTGGLVEHVDVAQSGAPDLPRTAQTRWDQGLILAELHTECKHWRT